MNSIDTKNEKEKKKEMKSKEGTKECSIFDESSKRKEERTEKCVQNRKVENTLIRKRHRKKINYVNEQSLRKSDNRLWLLCAKSAKEQQLLNCNWFVSQHVEREREDLF